MKGIAAVVAIALVAVTAFLIGEGIFLNVFIGSSVQRQEVAKELEIVKAVNRMEAVKRGLPYALYYSFLEAAETNDYETIDSIINLEDFETDITGFFDQYRVATEEKTRIVIPQGSTDLTIFDDYVILEFSSNGLLYYESESFKLFENSNVTIRIDENFELVE